ncbi:DarT1-associated NADAR antitoxin family protein [Avibacterium endocarditidis]
MNKKSIGKSKRPIFIPDRENIGVIEKNIEFDWHMGMSSEVRRRSIHSLHNEAKKYGYKKILEASSKSEQEIGIQLSAFFLRNIKGYPVENLFQSSKVFENGGPYRDLLTVTPREAKKDQRLKESGNLINFTFNGKDYPLEPKSLFYDWLYLNVLFSDRNVELRDSLFDQKFDAFTDIEFNPGKSFSCQARTLALCVSLYENESVKDFIQDPIGFSTEFKLYRAGNSISEENKNLTLF